MTLVEVAVAVLIAGLLSTAALALFRDSMGALGRAAARSRADAIGLEALGVAVALIEGAADVTAVADTALSIESLVVDAVPCGDGTGTPFWDAVPTPDDRWQTLSATPATPAAPATPGSLAWYPTTPRPLKPVGVACSAPDSSGRLIRVSRLSRLVAYRGGDGRWMLGLRRCADRCGVAEPLAGPIRAPADGGWRFHEVPCGLAVGVRALGEPAVRWRVARRC